MKTFLAVAMLAMLVPLAAPSAHAYSCTSTAPFPQKIGAGAATFYIDVRGQSLGDVWIYQESNHIDGLQRGGYDVIGSPDACVDFPHITPDTLIY